MIYEVHTRQWLHELGVGMLDAVTDATLDELAQIGVTYLWLMGVWPTGPKSRREAFVLRTEYDAALPGWRDEDVAGSPYAIAAYDVAAELGGDAALAALRGRLAKRGIRVLLDFVPNHVALDHPWTSTDYVMHEGKGIVHGKDPYFDPWTDTAQLEYRRAATRAAMRDVLLSIAERCDGVRCDMAMLVLPDVFAKTWAHVPCEEAASDFWGEAIRAVRAVRPELLFVAEAYWGLEQRLCELGFDLAYDKELYDRVMHGGDVAAHVCGADNARRVHFLENHDEPRAAGRVDRADLVLTLCLPGLAFLHHGQRDGARRFARIQLRRRAEEPVDREIRAMYDEVLRARAASSVGQGAGQLLGAERAWDENPSNAGFVIVRWPTDLVVVNTAPHRAQCRVRVDTGTWRIADRLSDERWDRDLGELFLDLPARGAQIFALQRMT